MHASLVRTSGLGYSLLFAVSLAVAWWQGRGGDLFQFPGWPLAAVHLMIGAGTAGGVLAAGKFARRHYTWARDLDAEFARLLAPLGTRDALILALASGIVEETFFRGVLQPMLGLYATSLAFGLLHYPMNRRMIPWTGIACLMGLVLGVVYEQTGSLLPVAVAHASINFVELRRIGSGSSEPGA